MNDNSPTGPKLKERVDLETLLTRAQDRLRSVKPPPKRAIDWRGWAGLIAGIIALAWVVWKLVT